MPDTSPNLRLPYLMQAQAQKHVTLNEALRALDALVLLGAGSRSAGAPPSSPQDGERHIVGPGATGSWSGHEGNIAAYQDGAWAFFEPQAGWLCHITDEDLLCVHDGTVWRSARIDLDNVPGLGVNAASDATNRLAVSSPAALFTHQGDDCQLKINKAEVADTASLVFQTSWSGRAEFGLAGEDAFSVKVSPDGSAWTQALRLNPATGKADFLEGAFNGDVTVSGDTWRGVTIDVAADNAWAQFACNRARGTKASPQPVRSGDTLFAFSPYGHDGTGYALAGGLSFIAESDFDVSASSFARLALVEAGVWKEVIRVGSSGNMGIGVLAPAARLDVDGPMRPGTYTVAGLPGASGLEGAIIYVSDASGGPVPAFSDGADWRRCDDRSIVT
ncbi:DUF2793 domain-containing protein [Henriciella mobilis]|uniref:DUF2793 domain-containing protein n=1 Tax=Henriciella mobilis TaxID=2305467 RepID=A0A399RKX0_9PROT|nr:DUF2793 domain-containing protein [Henriciella mobilis]RIJ32316.1 DUF2793 domain-containing protein [Henriciella mobilis]